MKTVAAPQQCYYGFNRINDRTQNGLFPTAGALALPNGNASLLEDIWYGNDIPEGV